MAVLKILESEYYPSGMDWNEIEEEFNYRVEEALNNIDYEPQSEESTGTDGIHDWRDNY